MAMHAEPEPVASIFDAEPEAEPVFHAADAEPEEAPLQLTDSMMVDETQAYQPQPEPMQHYAPQAYGQDYGQHLVSDAAAEASGASIAQLAHAVARERAVALGNQGITLEQLVREICTPLLKQWLDSNLPYMVERIVKQEIERIANRSDRM
jgi:cell pole-organizing protein PopZ